MKLLIPTLILPFIFITIIRSQDLCDPHLKPVGDKDIQYRSRGEYRCEGFYEAEAGGGIQLVGLLYGELNFDSNQDEEIIISVASEPDQEVIIRAEAIPLKTYYRMDGKILPERGTFSWPVGDVVTKAKTLTPQDLSVRGWVIINDKEHFVPLTVHPKIGIASEDQRLRAYFKSTSDLSNIKYLVIYKEESTEWKEPFITGVNAGNPIVINFPFEEKGIYKLVLSAEEKISNKPVISESIVILIE